MDDREARRIARQGQFYLQEAILGLLERHPEGLKLGPISRTLDLPEAGFNATVTGQLQLLEVDGKVHQPRGPYTEWTLTDSEQKKRTL